MPLLGLLNTEDFSRFTNIRRKVFYHWPNGAAPLTGLLSMLDGETTNDPEFSWWEKRLPEYKSTTILHTAGSGPFSGAAAATATWGNTLRTGGAGIDAGGASVLNDAITIKVTDFSKFRPGQVIQLRNVTITGPIVLPRVLFRIAAMRGTDQLDCNFLQVISAGMLNNGSLTNNGLEVLVVGNAFAQGQTGVTEEIYALPINPGNYCQIFRTPFSIAASAMQTAAKYDESGPYKDKAKDHSIQHMIEMEKAFIFGLKTKTTASGVPTYFTGGILNFLELWEMAASVYRGAASAAITLDTDDDKRIIANSGGTISEKVYDGYLERLFRVTNNVANEKLCLCGSGFLKVLNQMYRSKTTLTARQGEASTYGMTVVQHDTSFGTVYYKSHPLFSQNPVLRFNGLFVDVQNLRFRKLGTRDTQLFKNRQNNGDDFRRDEWLTEAGLELRFPESFMYLQNVQDYTP